MTNRPKKKSVFVAYIGFDVHFLTNKKGTEIKNKTSPAMLDILHLFCLFSYFAGMYAERDDALTLSFLFF